jgi:paraquat-inducible protein B
MSKKANPTTIGLFIVIGVALGVAGVLLFSSFKIFSPRRECIVYFNESLNGLNEGAPVKYRGVTIGSVKSVMVRFNQAPTDYAMPVIVEIRKDLLYERMGEQQEVFSDEALEERVKRGLRACLQSQSLVTGVLYVEMRPNPNAPPPVFHQLVKRYPEIPSEPTQIQELFNNLASVDIKSIETNVNNLLVKLDNVVSSLHMTEINRGITNVLVSIDRLVGSPDLTNDLAAAGRALEEFRRLGAKLNERVDPLADNITHTLAEADRALGQFRGAAENLRSMLAPDSPVRADLDLALQQIAGAAQSISALVEFLKQHPNALITGRQILPTKP